MRPFEVITPSSARHSPRAYNHVVTVSSVGRRIHVAFPEDLVEGWANKMPVRVETNGETLRLERRDDGEYTLRRHGVYRLRVQLRFPWHVADHLADVAHHLLDGRVLYVTLPAWAVDPEGQSNG